MTENDFLSKILRADYAAMTLEEYKLMAERKEVFGLGAKFAKAIEKAEKEGSLSEDDRAKVVGLIENVEPPTLFILNKLDNYPIDEGGIKIDFRAAFYQNLEKMSLQQVCYLIDTIGKENKKLHISMFGGMANEPAAYHAINKVISDAYGLQLVFDVFTKYNEKRFLKLDLRRIDKRGLANCLKAYCKLYFFLLEGISEAVLETSEEELPKKTLAHAIREKIKPYVRIIKEKEKWLHQDGGEAGEAWKYVIDRVYVEADEE